MNQLVSIIIPCYSAEKWIGDCIESALSQTYNPIEVIVIDDGSTDNSLAIIKKYNSKIKWLSFENAGQSASRNRGLKISTGKYIQFIDADDYISPNKIKEQVEFLELSGQDVIYSDWCYQYHNTDNTIKLSDYKIHQPPEDMVYYIFSANTIIHGSCLYRREVIEQISGFDESLRIAEDYDFSIRLALSGATFAYVNGCTYFYRIYNSSTASHGQGIKYPNSVKSALDKICLYLAENNLLNSKYRQVLAYKYFLVAKNYLTLGSFKESNLCYELANHFSENTKFRSQGNSKFEKVYNLFGWKITSTIMYFLRYF